MNNLIYTFLSERSSRHPPRQQRRRLNPSPTFRLRHRPVHLVLHMLHPHLQLNIRQNPRYVLSVPLSSSLPSIHQNTRPENISTHVPLPPNAIRVDSFPPIGGFPPIFHGSFTPLRSVQIWGEGRPICRGGMPFISTQNCPKMAKNSHFQPRKFTASIHPGKSF